MGDFLDPNLAHLQDLHHGDLDVLGKGRDMEEGEGAFEQLRPIRLSANSSICYNAKQPLETATHS